MTGYEISGRASNVSHGFAYLLTSFFNFRDMPQSTVKKDDILLGAWAMTGKHLRKALDDYGQAIKETENGRNSSK